MFWCVYNVVEKDVKAPCINTYSNRQNTHDVNHDSIDKKENIKNIFEAHEKKFEEKSNKKSKV